LFIPKIHKYKFNKPNWLINPFQKYKIGTTSEKFQSKPGLEPIKRFKGEPKFG